MIDFVLSSFSYIIIILRFWDYSKKFSHEEQRFSRYGRGLSDEKLLAVLSTEERGMN